MKTTFSLLIVLLATSFVVLDACNNKGEKRINETENNYVGAEKCMACHTKEYKDWLRSNHFHAMEEAKPSSVKGNFNQTSYTSDKVSYSFWTKDSGYYFSEKEDGGKADTFKVRYTFGYHPLQQYLIEQAGGKLQTSRFSWDTKQQKWFHQYKGSTIAKTDWLHWTQGAQNWNTMCAACHSTGVNKAYNEGKDAFQTSFAAVNVSCESCHGMGKLHTQNPKENTLSSLPVLNTCAPCHARKTDLQANLETGVELLNHFVPQVISSEFYEPDGQIKEEDFELGSFMQSKMYKNGVSCNNCHQPHTGKLLKAGNALCLNCHEPKYDSKAHHFHAQNTEGSSCVNCHMPQKTYMGNHVRHDHSFRVPRPDQSMVYKTPNTCNSCHAEKSAQWAANEISKRFGSTRKPHFSDYLLPGSKPGKTQLTSLFTLLNDTSESGIVRATALLYLGLSNNNSAVLNYLSDKEPMVRYQVAHALKYLNPELWVNKAGLLLKDPIKAVRIAAAASYHTLPDNLIPQELKPVYLSANEENKAFLNSKTDFASGNMMKAEHLMQEGAYPEAIKYYERGLAKDNQLHESRTNLAIAYSAIGQPQEAVRVLEVAQQYAPLNGEINYQLALVYFQQGNKNKAKDNFEKALKKDYLSASLYYNYTLFLKEEKQLAMAEKITKLGLKKFPGNDKLNYAWVFILLETNRTQEAKEIAQQLALNFPSNPEYLQLAKTLSAP